MKLWIRWLALGTVAAAAPAADFSYYMLALSYAPEFCAQPGGNKDPRECGPGRRAFVVHGLWPQNDHGRGPQHCAPARPVPADLVRSMLNYFPTESLIQHEWATHGTCAGLTAAEYLALVRRARDSVRIPPRLEELGTPVLLRPFDLENEFAAANPGIPRDGFRTACYPDAGLEEIRICFDKSLTARSCGGAAECVKGTIRLRPSAER